MSQGATQGINLNNIGSGMSGGAPTPFQTGTASSPFGMNQAGTAGLTNTGSMPQSGITMAGTNGGMGGGMGASTTGNKLQGMQFPSTIPGVSGVQTGARPGG